MSFFAAAAFLHSWERQFILVGSPRRVSIFYLIKNYIKAGRGRQSSTFSFLFAREKVFFDHFLQVSDFREISGSQRCELMRNSHSSVIKKRKEKCVWFRHRNEMLFTQFFLPFSGKAHVSATSIFSTTSKWSSNPRHSVVHNFTTIAQSLFNSKCRPITFPGTPLKE